MDVELIGGPEHRDIVLVDYDPRWPAIYAEHAARIRAALGEQVRVEHVGSTAVPGLVAKPIVDMQVSVADVEAEDTYVPALERSGYVLRVRERGHRMLRTPARGVHVHVCPVGSAWERRHLLFRDRLRADTDDRWAYGALKRQLAAQDWETMNHYAAAKDELIGEIMQRAEQWAVATGWRVA